MNVKEQDCSIFGETNFWHESQRPRLLNIWGNQLLTWMSKTKTAQYLGKPTSDSNVKDQDCSIFGETNVWLECQRPRLLNIWGNQRLTRMSKTKTAQYLGKPTSDSNVKDQDCSIFGETNYWHECQRPRLLNIWGNQLLRWMSKTKTTKTAQYLGKPASDKNVKDQDCSVLGKPASDTNVKDQDCSVFGEKTRNVMMKGSFSYLPERNCDFKWPSI